MNFIIFFTDEAVQKESENILPELYRLWVQRKALENAGYGIPLEHLMIRKSQRSPSLRLRFGRSGPAIPVSIIFFQSLPFLYKEPIFQDL